VELGQVPNMGPRPIHEDLRSRPGPRSNAHIARRLNRQKAVDAATLEVGPVVEVGRIRRSGRRTEVPVDGDAIPFEDIGEGRGIVVPRRRSEGHSNLAGCGSVTGRVVPRFDAEREAGPFVCAFGGVDDGTRYGCGVAVCHETCRLAMQSIWRLGLEDDEPKGPERDGQ